MLSKLYGGGPKPKISYPKPRVMPRRAEDTRAFVPAGGKADTDYRVDKRKDTSGLVVPRVGGHDMVLPRPRVSPPHTQSPHSCRCPPRA